MFSIRAAGPAFSSALLFATAAILAPSGVQAQETLVSGRIILAEGHENPACRRIRLHTDSGPAMWFRLPDTGADNGILSVALSALATGKPVDIGYNPTVSGTCGTEPKVGYISIRAE
jgi:hypothetical protein